MHSAPSYVGKYGAGADFVIVYTMYYICVCIDYIIARVASGEDCKLDTGEGG